MVLLKALRKTLRHKDATIFHHVHCFFIYFKRVDTVISSVESFCWKCKNIDIWQMNTSTVLILQI